MQAVLQARQRGISILGLIVVLVIAILVALLAFKLIPSYMEFRAMKGAIAAIAREKQNSTVQEIRRAFESRQAVKATDLDITKQGNQVVIAFAYRKEIPLFANVGIYIDFAASSLGD
jgi:Tfp pilus assembly protein PilE